MTLLIPSIKWRCGYKENESILPLNSNKKSIISSESVSIGILLADYISIQTNNCLTESSFHCLSILKVN